MGKEGYWQKDKLTENMPILTPPKGGFFCEGIMPKEQVQHQLHTSADQVLTPAEFRNCYTTYYALRSEDSPYASRAFLISKICEEVRCQMEHKKNEGTSLSDHKIRMLSLGAGIQILEKEMQRALPEEMLQSLEIITLDIADIDSKQLLAGNYSHATADGSVLPFTSDSFDIVYSNMAIDFMPRQAFEEAYRVLDSDGTLLVNFHHPNLITINRLKIDEVAHRLRSAQQKIRNGRKSSHYSEYVAKFEAVLLEYNDVKFVLTEFPNHIFHSVREIDDYFTSNLSFTGVQIEEHTGKPGENGWFFLRARKE